MVRARSTVQSRCNGQRRTPPSGPAQRSIVPNVTIHPTGEVIYLEPDETVLTGLYKAGYAYTVGCKRGGCGICKVDCSEGTFSYERPIACSVISDEERADR